MLEQIFRDLFYMPSLCMLGFHKWEEWCEADNYTWPRDSGGQFLPDDLKADCSSYLRCRYCGKSGRGWHD